jgi:hypothetical protein
MVGSVIRQMRIDQQRYSSIMVVLDDLRQRLARSPCPGAPDGPGWRDIASLAFLQDLVVVADPIRPGRAGRDQSVPALPRQRDEMGLHFVYVLILGRWPTARRASRRPSALHVSTRDEPANLSHSRPETHQHCSPAGANCCQSLLLDPAATISIDLHKRLFLLVIGRGE